MIEFLEPEGQGKTTYTNEMTRGVNWGAVVYVSVVWLLLLLTVA